MELKSGRIQERKEYPEEKQIRRKIPRDLANEQQPPVSSSFVHRQPYFKHQVAVEERRKLEEQTRSSSEYSYQ